MPPFSRAATPSANGLQNNVTGPSLTPVLTTLIIKLTPLKTPLEPGQSSTASASGLDQSGFPIAVGTVVWSSTAPGVATVSNAGVVTGVAFGQAQIVGTRSEQRARRQPSPSRRPAPILTSISVSFGTNPIYVGQTAKANFSGLDQYGAPYPIGVINWSSGSPGIATVNPIGGITGVGVGQAQIIASAGAIQGQAALTVQPVPVGSITLSSTLLSVNVGLTAQLTATAYDMGGSIINSAAITWTSSDTTKAKVSTTGLVTGIAVGRVTVTAQSGGKTAMPSRPVTVTSDISFVSVSPGNATLVVGQTTHTTATVAVVNGASTGITFSSSNPPSRPSRPWARSRR